MDVEARAKANSFRLQMTLDKAEEGAVGYTNALHRSCGGSQVESIN